MSTKDLKALERRFFNECNKGKAAAMAAIDELCATDFVYHTASGTDVYGPEGFKKLTTDMFNAVPDVRWIIDDMIVEGDKAVLRYTITGIHKGEYMGKPPTNNKVTSSIIKIDRFAGGKLVEGWYEYDTLGLMQQLGVIPMPKK